MSEIDELFDLKNSYYLGNFSHTVNEANKLKLSKCTLSGVQGLEAILNSLCTAINLKQGTCLIRDVSVHCFTVGHMDLDLIRCDFIIIVVNIDSS